MAGHERIYRAEAKKNPKESANVFSILLFSWMNSTFITGNKRPLENSDLFQLLDEDKTQGLTERLEETWNEEHRRHPGRGTKRPSLLWALICVFHWSEYVFVLCLDHNKWLLSYAATSFPELAVGCFDEAASRRRLDGVRLWRRDLCEQSTPLFHVSFVGLQCLHDVHEMESGYHRTSFQKGEAFCIVLKSVSNNLHYPASRVNLHLTVWRE